MKLAEGLANGLQLRIAVKELLRLRWIRNMNRRILNKSWDIHSIYVQQKAFRCLWQDRRHDTTEIRLVLLEKCSVSSHFVDMGYTIIVRIVSQPLDCCEESKVPFPFHVPNMTEQLKEARHTTKTRIWDPTNHATRQRCLHPKRLRKLRRPFTVTRRESAFPVPSFSLREERINVLRHDCTHWVHL